MKKIQFQNATQTAPATVTINGVNHDVTPAVIEGGTLPTPDNLNQLQNNVEAVLNGEESIEKIVVGDIECKNILSSDLIKGVYAYATGLFANSNVYVCTRNYIPVIAGKQITISTSYSSPEIGIVYYNDNNERISSKVGTSGIVPEGATKLVICIKKSDDATTISPSDVEWIQLEYGSKATSYVPHKKYGYNSTESMGKIVVDDIKCKNLFNKYGKLNEKFDYTTGDTTLLSDGTIKATSNWAVGNGPGPVVILEPNKDYIVSFDVVSMETAGNCIFRAYGINEDGSVTSLFNKYFSLKGKHIQSFNTGKYSKIWFSFNGIFDSANTANYKYVIYDNVQIEKGTVVTEYTPSKSLGYTSGSNENGSWVKYDDGRMECTQIISLIGLEITETFGSCFFAIKEVPDFPLVFKEPPVISFGLSGGFTVMVGNGEETTINGVQKVVIIRPERGTIPSSVPVNLHITAKGRWK